MRSFLNATIHSAIALATVATLGIPVLFATPAEAACLNNAPPRGNIYQLVRQPDGSMYVNLSVSDADYPNYRRLFIYNQFSNNPLVNQAWNYWQGVVPKGQVFRFAAPNMNTCAQQIGVTEFYRVDNR